MSALSHYIHYTAQGYEDHGITQSGSHTLYNFSGMKNDILKKIKGQESINENTDIENVLNLFKSNANSSDEESKKIRLEVENKLKEKYGETMGRINWNTLNIERQSVVTAKNTVVSKIVAGESQDSILLSTLLKRVHVLEEIMETLTDSKKEAELRASINSLYKNINELVTGAKKGRIGEFRSTTADDLGKLSSNNKIALNSTSKDGSISARGLVSTINELMKTYSSAPAINLQKGDFFEYLVSLAPYLATNKAEVTINSCFESVVGGNRSHIEIKFDKGIEKDISGLDFQRYYSNSGTHSLVSYGVSQDKIDVNMDWGGTIMPVSVKNVNLSKTNEISILNGASLDSFLNNETNDFRYHIYNILAEHGVYSDDGPKDNTSQLNGYQDGRTALKWMVFYNSLAGSTSKAKTAELFIINDNSVKGGGVKVFKIYDLITKAMDDIDSYSKITGNGTDLNALTIQNNFNYSYEERRNSFLNKIHKVKLKTALNTKLLQKV